ncbi:MAG: riboflavin synthase [Cytophagia bacterium]|jgi:riboflavin synthase|nr:riboflavin synthase [Cytophagia bacterium]|tara:strand:- start:766 stop:1350 length:585 start_codon:yes stop_codon:yes gene_type:complete
MFTGIIESVGEIKSIVQNMKNIDMEISSPISGKLRVDESICHNGVCLTVIEFNSQSHKVTLVDETLKKSNFSKIKIGSHLNLERSMKANGRLDGHIVQGHVDDVAECTNIVDQSNSWLYTFKISEDFSNYIIEKGSICVNGVSLTCFDIKKDQFTVAIIPHTYKNTNFNLINIGDFVNIEFDILGKYINKILKK